MTAQSSKSLPWYRVPMLWFAISLPLLTVLAGLLTYHFALGDPIDSNPDVVKRVAQMQISDLTADEATLRRNLHAVAKVESGSGEITLHVQGIADNEHLSMRLIHATRAPLDQDIPLRSVEPGLWAGTLVSGHHGLYRVELRPEDESWRLIGALHDTSTQITLLPSLGVPND